MTRPSSPLCMPSVSFAPTVSIVPSMSMAPSISAALLVLVLAGCVAGGANVTGEWDCPAQEGKACASIGEADAGVSAAGPPIPLLPPAAGADATSWAGAPAGPHATSGANAPGYDPRRVRRTEVVARVWFHPFVDSGGHYHEGGFVHVIMRPADWQAAPEHMFPDGPRPSEPDPVPDPMEKPAQAPVTGEAGR